MISIELLTKNNFSVSMPDNYEIRHDVKKVWRREGGEYVLADEPYTEYRDLEKRRSVAEGLAESEPFDLQMVCSVG